MQSLIKNQLTQSQDVLSSFLKSESELQKIEKAGHLITTALQDGGKVISCGNGGSHCDAMHFAEEMTGRYRDNRAPMAAICISDPAHITCVGNDYGFEYVFSRYVEALGKDGDVLLALSTSGNSGNILKAINAAKSQNMGTVLLTGETGGAMHGLADVEINIPHTGYADRIQEVHIKIIHILILLVETQLQASD